MHFKTLEIHGFKSFPDKTLLHFDRRMTAVVGSNGNGKSNISDALRWVMGEQGAKSLRGDKMEDVIFHGTTTRPQMGFAKVSLTIDNSDRKLSYPADEVVITRKLYRTGESEYLINGEKKRLKDIHELLMGTGLGRDGYSVIRQGRIAQIVDAKHTGRRELFEEAAGVSKFLHKKAESERELSRAEENILRLKDIESELEQRIPVLSRQAEKARKAKALLEEEKKLLVSVSVHRMGEIERSLIETEDQILLSEAQCGHFNREIEELEQLCESLAYEKAELAQKLDTLRREGEDYLRRSAENEKTIAVLENEIQNNKRRIQEIQQRIETAKQSDVELITQIEEQEQLRTEKQQDILSIHQELEEKRATLLKMAESDEDSEYQRLDRLQSALYAKKTEGHITAAQAKTALEEAQQRLEQNRSRIQELEALISAVKEERKALEQQKDAITEEKTENENRLAGYERLLESKLRALEDKKQDFDSFQKDYERKKSRLEILSDVEKNMAGYYGSVKAVITAGRNGQMGGIHGTVADIIRVEKKYALAIETALGSALQNIIVENEETAKRCIRFLSETNAGRATFLPLTSVKGERMNQSSLDNEDGFEGIASDLVAYDSKYDGILQSVLGTTVIVDDIDTAAYLAKKYGYKFRIITLDGQIVNRGGSFTGGSVNKTQGIITRKQEITTLTAEVEKLTKVMSEKKQELDIVQAETAKFRLETEGLRERIMQCNTRIETLSAQIEAKTGLIQQYDNQAEIIEDATYKEQSQIEQRKAVIREFEAIEKQADEELRKLEEKIRTVSQRLEEAGEKKRLISEEITALEMKKLSLEKDIESIGQRITTLHESRAQLDHSGEAFHASIKEIETQIQQIQEQIQQARDEGEQLKQTFGTNADEIQNIIQRTTQIEGKITQANKDIREKSDDKEHFSNALVVARERKETLLQEKERILSELWEKHEITFTEAKAMAIVLENPRQSQLELSDIRRKLQALGNVNFAAAEEYNEVKARYDELATQLRDLEKSKRDLTKLIEHLTAETKDTFIKSFETINRNFKRVFTEMFGGGSARLELTDPDDVLNSGIEIYAAPPGKVIKNLISLSGGEQTMVAITIYFAILLTNPTPFCMLDEVDAALDEENIQKYVTYLRRFSAQTQLMLITHRRGTIEGCDMLYGVFMREKGVTRLLKQELTKDTELELEQYGVV